jgi:hypothetical protein
MFYNNSFTEIDISSNVALAMLSLQGNNLKALDLASNRELTELLLDRN